MSNDNDRQTLDRLLEELDVKGHQQHPGDTTEKYWVCRRRHPRYSFRASCVVRFVAPGTTQIISATGRTRNLSRSGLAILVKRVFSIGDPLEVEIQLPGQPVMYMGGLVQFVRYAGRGYHEIGVALRAAGRQPIFTAAPEVALDTLDWFKQCPQASR